MLKLYFVIYLLVKSTNVVAHDFKTYHYHYEYILCISFLVLTIITIYKRKKNGIKNYS